mmetsp:Transcript_615/g.1845  ORF Transcript_615/g.1845 Transcript_615/m.1845 type:complete len:228 (+) Transcript_615:1502-2185(+)
MRSNPLSSALAPPHWPLMTWFRRESARRFMLAISTAASSCCWSELIACPHSIPVMWPNKTSMTSSMPMPYIGCSTCIAVVMAMMPSLVDAGKLRMPSSSWTMKLMNPIATGSMMKPEGVAIGTMPPKWLAARARQPSTCLPGISRCTKLILALGLAGRRKAIVYKTWLPPIISKTNSRPSREVRSSTQPAMMAKRAKIQLCMVSCLRWKPAARLGGHSRDHCVSMQA